METKNILIVENNTDHLTAIKRSLESKLPKHIAVFPVSLTDSENNPNNNNYLIGKITEGQYKEVFDFHKNIHLYVVDVYLVNDTDKLGLEFARYIMKNRFDDFKIVIISNNVIQDDLVTMKNDKVIFFSKFDRGIKNFPIDLAKVVINIFKIDLQLDEKQDPSQSNTTNTPTVNQKSRDAKDPISYHLHVIWEYIRDNANRLIDKLIHVAFYVLLFFTIASSMWNILLTIKGSFSKFHEDAKSNNIASIKDDTSILKSAEHIFLYLLPVFIIFGFFNYYKTNTRITLLGGKNQDNDNENSAKAVNLTKVLFISSIVSYVIIKVIEIVFFKQANSYNKPEDYLIILISSGLLLFLLMTYFIFLYREKH